MSRKTRSIQWTGGILALWLLISSCGLIRNTTAVGDTTTDSHTVELGSANKVNEAYGSSPHTLFLDVQAGIGSIHLDAP